MTLLQTRSRTKPRNKLALEGVAFAFWSPVGSPGKSTLALNIAYELADLGKRVLLIDLDTYAPSLNQLLPIPKPTAGLAGVARLIRQGRFTMEELDRLSIQVVHRKTRFQVLTGLGSSSRWPEITGDTVQQLLKLAKLNFDYVITDLASPIEENLIDSNHVTPRNAATRNAIELADLLLVVLADSQSFLARYLSVTTQTDELQKSRVLIVNKSESNPKMVKTLRELTGESIFCFVPNDEPTVQLSERQLLPLAIARRKSLARNAVSALAHKLLAWQPSVN